MIKHLSVKKLNSKLDLDLEFNPDLNIITGKNGSSKTTLLKLIWFLNGGQIYNLIREINFKSAEITTSSYTSSIIKEKGRVKISFNGKQLRSFSEENIRELQYEHYRYQRYFLEFRKFAEPTIFFPTFRRIEGGFMMDKSIREPFGPEYSIKEAMDELSERLTFGNQKFVASISTDDIISLLTKEYTEANENINRLQKKQSENIIKRIKYKTKTADEILSAIQKDVEKMEKDREEYLKSFSILGKLIEKIFQHKGIVLRNLTFGDVSDAISSDKLSAGEKQMLSFICYNTFSKNMSIFIDEPELSLHPDWQRILVPTLLNQKNNNQFFLATHSPFIYSKYPDKEIILSNDKGE